MIDLSLNGPWFFLRSMTLEHDPKVRLLHFMQAEKMANVVANTPFGTVLFFKTTDDKRWHVALIAEQSAFGFAFRNGKKQAEIIMFEQEIKPVNEARIEHFKNLLKMLLDLMADYKSELGMPVNLGLKLYRNSSFTNEVRQLLNA